MAGGKQRQTKAERKRARAGGQTKAERKQAQGKKTKAELKQAKAARRRGARAAVAAVPDAPGEDAAPEERIEWRLARIEEAVATQSQRSDELLEKVDSMLQEASESAAPDDKGD